MNLCAKFDCSTPDHVGVCRQTDGWILCIRVRSDILQFSLYGSEFVTVEQFRVIKTDLLNGDLNGGFK